VGKKGPNKVICIPMDKELTNREGDYVIEKKKRNHRCAQGGVGTD
ncbi:hypothetical protein L249_8436, partial [Ophiocordyceps polyrhachis-furcata BCC 54312]